MTREEAHNILMDVVEQVSALPSVHRRLWEAITTLDDVPAPAQNGTEQATVAPGP